MYSAVLLKMYQTNHFAATRNLEGFTHAESMVTPPGGGNSTNWVVGHIVSTRNAILALLGRPPVLEGVDLAVYQRGSEGLDGRELPFETLLAAFNESQARIEAALREIGESRFQALVTEEKLGQNIAFLQFHEAYHIGQLGLLRRIAGKPGAIR
jgi:hypothetical protein